MILFLAGLFTGATLGILLLGLFINGKLSDAYMEGRLDEITDRALERR